MDLKKQLVLAETVESDPRRVELRTEFLNWLKKNHDISEFTDPHSLEVAISASLTEIADAQLDEDAKLRLIHKRLSAQKKCRWDMLAVSAHNVDRFYSVEQIRPDFESRVRKVFPLMPGGSGANTAVALSRLGKRTVVAGIIADDKQGDKLRQNLRDEGVDARLLVKYANKKKSDEKLRTGETMVLVSQNGRRQIALFPGVNEHWALQSKDKQRKKELFRAVSESKIVHFSSFTGHSELDLQTKLLGKLGDKILSFSPGELYSNHGFDGLRKVLLRTDVLFVYARELVNLIKTSPYPQIDQHNVHANIKTFFQCMSRFKRRTPLIIVVKDRQTEEQSEIGRDFLTLAIGTNSLDKIFKTTGLRVPTEYDILDSTGAGGAIAAGVLYGLLEKQDLQFCVDAAYVLSALVSSDFGAQTRLPTERLLQRCLKDWKKPGR